MTQPNNLNCGICGEAIPSDEIVWINPLGYGGGSKPQENGIPLGPVLCDENSGGGCAPYHRHCATQRYPELGLPTT